MQAIQISAIFREMSSLNSQDWNARYASGDTPWDMRQPSPPLVALLRAGKLPYGRVLIPGCGSGYEVALLAEAGFDVIGADYAESAIAAARKTSPALTDRFICADLLAGDVAEKVGTYDWAYDQTFFCAIEPQRRNEYAVAIARLVRIGGELIALSMRAMDPSGGPPYDSTPQEYVDLMSRHGFVEIERRALVEESLAARRGRETLVRMRRAESAQTPA